MLCVLLQVASKHAKVRHLAPLVGLPLGPPDHAQPVRGDFELVPLGGDRYRIRDTTTNRCLYSSPYNGGATKVWDCWNDPNMV